MKEQSTLAEFCDESKCVSRGLSSYHENSFTCYGDENGAFYPMMCADGYEPYVLDSVSPVEDNTYPPWMIRIIEDRPATIPMRYFTCCPPEMPLEKRIQVSRDCSDPSIIGNKTSVNCDHDNRQFPRRMKPYYQDIGYKTSPAQSFTVESFLCCDTLLNQTKDLLKDQDCVPYHNEHYAESKVKNVFKSGGSRGMISAILCDFEESEFSIPRRKIIEGNHFVNFTAYECCKSGRAMPTYVKDAAYTGTFYPLIAALVISSILCSLLLLALFVSLVQALTKERCVQPDGRRHSLRSRLPRGFSPYNLYLFYLVIPDLAINLFYISWLYDNIFKAVVKPESFYHTPYGYFIYPSPSVHATGLTYIGMNCWMNAVVAYEVLRLLNHSYRSIRMPPISLRRVNLQAGTVYVCTAALYFASRWMNQISRSEETNQDFYFLVFITITSVHVFLPVGFVFAVSVKIWWCGYLAPADGSVPTRDKGTRELFWYFFRIFIVFLCSWLPVPILAFLVRVSGTINLFTFAMVGVYCIGIQPIITFFLALTKSDVRQFVKNLVTCSFHVTEQECHSSSLKLPVGPTTSYPIPVLASTPGPLLEDTISGSKASV